MEILGFAIYLAVKAIAYVGWCYAGVRLLDPGRPAPFRRAVGLGLAASGSASSWACSSSWPPGR
ncbi:MAG TPA: hypothetical protein VGR67_14250 [Candidatus Polarisedimenticolia bacterium]|nr:hypothetical protein [Candidatus Polarisedimenticolia bacterium]